jgi:hypothetical protein
MSRPHAEAICAHFKLDVSPAWLAEGKGPKKLALVPTTSREKQDGEDGPDEQAVPVRTVTESQWSLLEDFDVLPREEQESLRATLRAKASDVKRIVADYLQRTQGVKGPSATDARVAESYGSPPVRENRGMGEVSMIGEVDPEKGDTNANSDKHPRVPREKHQGDA